MLDYPLYNELVRRIKLKSERLWSEDKVNVSERLWSGRACNFELNVSERLQNKRFYDIDAEAISATINALPSKSEEHYEELCAIIRYYEETTDEIQRHEVMPGGLGLLYTVSNLSLSLQQILEEYIDYYS